MTLTKISAVLTQISVTLPEIYVMVLKMRAALTLMCRTVSGICIPLSLIHSSQKPTGWRLTLAPRNVPSWECLWLGRGEPERKLLLCAVFSSSSCSCC